MLLTIHDASLRKVAFIDNDKQATLNYFNDAWTRYLETGSSTFDFTVLKKAIISDVGRKRAYNYLNEKAFVSFQYKGKTYLHTIRKVEENEQIIKCYGINLNLELINEYANPYKAPRAMTFKEYCDAMDLLNFTFLKIGVNEISTQKISAEWEGTDTKLNRLLSLAKKFGAEIEFDTHLNVDSSIKSFVVNVYHENDDDHQGVGRVSPTILKYGKNLKALTRTVDKTNIYNAVRPTGRTEDGKTITISGLGAWSVKNAKGEREFYQSGEMLYAPLSMQMYPAAFTSVTMGDQWIRKDMTVESSNPEVIRSAAYRELKKNCYPAVTYEAEGFADLEIGDTVKVYDDGFSPVLLLEMRVSEQTISFTNPKNNKTTFSNAKALENLLSKGIQERLDRMIEDAKPYTVKVSTNNGTAFKNGQGQSVVTPTLMKGNRVINSGWRWVVNGEIKATSPTYIVKAADINQTMVLTIAAWIDNQEVASEQITFLNASDGLKGDKGDPGKDGLPGAPGVGIKSTVSTYGLSANETTQPTSWTATVPSLVKGQYLWTKHVWTYTDGRTETGYTKTYIPKDGNNGTNGIAGKDGVGISSTTITYASSSSGTNAPTSGWTTSVPNVAPGQYLWTKTVWTYSDNTTETGYSVAKMGDTGAKGEKGDPGKDGLPGAPGVGIKSTVSTYGLSSNETTQPATWTSTVPSLIKGQYLWTKNVWTYTDGRTETGYTKTYIPRDGNDGTNGIAGKDGVGIKSTSITYAASSSGTTAPTSGWSTSVPTVPPGQYLWTKTIWSYTDNTTETGYSVAKMGEKGDQGLPGPKGADGKSSYTHIAYANMTQLATENSSFTLSVRSTVRYGKDANWFYKTFDAGTYTATNATFGGDPYPDITKVAELVDGFSTSNSAEKAYIGVYVDFNSADSTNPADYNWTLIKGADGAQGIPGPKGADGKTPYVHFAYADNADGTGLTLTDNGQRYMGYYTDYTQDDSTDKTKYRWADRWAKIEVGGRNLIDKTSEAFVMGYGITNTTWNPETKRTRLTFGAGVERAKYDEILPQGSIFESQNIIIKQNQTYTQAIRVATDATFLGTGNLNFTWYGPEVVSGTNSHRHYPASIRKIGVNEYLIWSTVTWDRPDIYLRPFDIYNLHTSLDFRNTGTFLEFYEPKLELGTVPTAHSISENDRQRQLDSKADQALTQEQLNALNEKNQILEAEMKAKASMEAFSKFEKAYQAFVKSNADGQAKAEADLIEAGRRIELLTTQFGGFAELKTFIDTYMSGSNEGLIIGKNDASSTIKVSSDRISMFSAGEEVMYISQGVIHIDNGIFTKSLQIGRFRTEQYELNADMNVIRYVG